MPPQKRSAPPPPPSLSFPGHRLLSRYQSALAWKKEAVDGRGYRKRLNLEGKELVILLNYCTFQDLHKTGSDLYMYNCSLNVLQIVDQAKSPISTFTSNTTFSVIV